MTNERLAQALSGAAESAGPALRAWAEFWSQGLLLPLAGVCGVPGGAGSGGSTQPQRSRLRAQVWEIRRLLREALGGGLGPELGLALNELVARRGELERLFVVWVDLVEVLVQTEERRFGSAPGKGRLKAEEVRSVVHFLMNEQTLQLPRIPSYMQALVLDVLADWSVDAVVLVANRYGLWTSDAAPPRRGWEIGRRIGRALGRLFRPLLEAGVRLAMAIRRLSHRRAALRPEVRAALEAIRRESLLERRTDFAGAAVRLFVWMGRHREQLLAGFDLVFAAVQEAEYHASLSGAEKRAYARDLVLAVLDELGFTERVGLLFATVDSLISGAIESGVHLFHKRGVFTPRAMA